MTRRVMVVDDEKGIREALRQLLEYEELEVRTASSGMEALKTYPSKPRSSAPTTSSKNRSTPIACC
jgi:CheY-like chemotaxis protein